MTRKLLWVGDACCDSGFEKCTRSLLTPLHEKGWQIEVLGLNYFGDPHDYPFKVYPAAQPMNPTDFFGYRRIAPIAEKLKPDCIVIQNDPWNVAGYYYALKDVRAPILGIIALDGLNCPGHLLNLFQRVVFWTRFAQQEALLGGLTRPSSVMPLGVDLDRYQPIDKTAARQALGIAVRGEGESLPADAFIIGNVNRNHYRKHLDLTIAYVGEWVRTRGLVDVYLYLHCLPAGPKGFHLPQLMDFFGLSGRGIYPPADKVGVIRGVNELTLAVTYNCFDVQITTSQGEGWGLPTMEGMACAVPQIVGDWAALGEWTEDAAIKVPCTSVCAIHNNINVIGGLPDRDAVLDALDRCYADRAYLAEMAERGRRLVDRDTFRWPTIAAQLEAEIETTIADAQISGIVDRHGQIPVLPGHFGAAG